MQSSWQRIAREAFRWSQHRPASIRNLASNPKFLHKPIPHYRQCRRTIATASVKAPETPFPVEASSRAVPEPTNSILKTTLTPARNAFAAAAAARLSVAEGNLVDAYHIVNSMFYAKNRTTSPVWHALTGLLPTNAFKPDPIPFSPETPTRLVTHSLLHSLMRYGYHKEAAQMSKSLMQQGVRIHWGSLHMVFHALTSAEAKLTRIPLEKIASKNALRDTLDGSIIRHRGASLAFELLQVARQSRQRKTRFMFRTIIAICLINGEIIAASLIFGLMMKDWNAYVAEVTATGEGPSTAWGTPHHVFPTPYPQGRLLAQILTSIRKNISVASPSKESGEAIQALTNLASFVDERMVHCHLTYLLGTIVSTMNHAQGTERWVRVPCKDKPGTVSKEMSQYFDEVLYGLATNLPDYKAAYMDLRPPVDKNNGSLPALSLDSYQKMLRYALQSRHSVELVDVILDHMHSKRNPPLRGGRDNAVTSETLAQEAVRLDSEELWDRSLALLTFRAPETAEKDRSKPMIERYASGLSHQASRKNVKLLTARIHFLVASGRPDLVKPALTRLLPGFRADPLPSEEAFQQAYLPDMHLAVERGPNIIVAVLNALCQTGSMGTMIRVWAWAKRVENFSWQEFENEKGCVASWSLPIQAYTIMLTALGPEVKRGAKLGLERQEGGSYALVKKADPGKSGKPEQAMGLAPSKLSLENQFGEIARDSTPSRHDAALARARAIYASAFRAHERFTKKERYRSKEHNTLHLLHELPKPDQTFFNAMLDIVGREPEMLPRGPKKTPKAEFGRAERYVRKGEEWFKKTGKPPRDLNVDLLRVGGDILNAGYPIPPLLRPFFIGHGMDYTRNDISRGEWEASKLSLYRIH